MQLGSGYYWLSDITKDSTYYVNYWNDIIRKTKNTNNKLHPAFSYLKLGDFYFHKGNKDIALNKYLESRKQATKANIDSLRFISTYRIGIIKAHNKEHQKAIRHFKEFLSFYKKKGTIGNLNEYSSVLFNLSNSFESLKQYDSALYYNAKVYTIGKENKDSIITGYANFYKGSTLYKKKEYLSAINYFKKSIHFIKLDENYYILSVLYKYLGKSYHNLNDKKNALKYFNKVDSLFNKTKNYYSSQKPAYKYLINHYKEKGNDTKQLVYINKYIKVDSVLNTRSKNIAKNLTENYDIPNLLTEKKRIENRLKNKLSNFEKWIWSITLFSITILVFLIVQYRKRKQYKKRFQALLEKQPIRKSSTNSISVKKENLIPKETIETIKEQLLEFETKHQFISTQVSLSTLARLFNTNTKYLSQIINQEKGQSFNNYINQLRINYTIEKLKTDRQFRKYSVKAIAHEVGFNTTESFSKAFFKFTGIKPSYFIKELNKKVK
ncbi:MAG: AraC family transcriptional regulator, partial [Flavobacteriaceae bacterium]|nr:AraC family transcriptional regulator [Flavobacteriaceae bacterium]